MPTSTRLPFPFIRAEEYAAQRPIRQTKSQIQWRSGQKGNADEKAKAGDGNQNSNDPGHARSERDFFHMAAYRGEGEPHERHGEEIQHPMVQSLEIGRDRKPAIRLEHDLEGYDPEREEGKLGEDKDANHDPAIFSGNAAAREPLLYEADRKRVAVKLAINRFDDGNDRKNDREESDDRQQQNADEDKTEKKGDKAVNIDADVKIQRFFCVVRSERGILLLHEVNDEREDETDPEQERQMAEDDPDLVVTGGGGGKGRRRRRFHRFFELRPDR
jgi:hypothetical protein